MQKFNAERKMRTDWNRYAGVHDDLFASVGRGPDPDQLRIGVEDIAQKLLLEPHNQLLEIGCGTGLLLSSLSQQVSSSVGLDFSIKNIDIARRHFPRVSFVVGDAMGLPFRGGSFDRILSYSVFHYLSDVKRGIEETLRVCKEGGIVLLGDLPDIRRRWHLYLYYMRSFSMICRTPRDLWKKFKERIYSVNWHWVDVETLRDEMRSLGHEAEILAPPQHLQFGCKAYATRVDLKLRKKPI
jgi:ubiquinone/menaquinone biosynthesis C-methylase UbiE